MKLGFYLKYAWRSLRRGGQRTVLAILCIAFGVLSLVAMQLLVSMIFGALSEDPRVELGGDLMAQTASGYIESEQRAELERLREEGLIADYTLVAHPRGMMKLKREGTGQVHFLNRSMGIDPSHYPLMGEIELQEPANATLASVLQKPEDAIITRDLVEEQGLGMGDQFWLLGIPGSPPVPMRVAGVARGMPDGMGDTVIYNMEMAARLAGRSNPETNVEMLTIRDSEVREFLDSGGWWYYTPELVLQDRERVSLLFSFMLKGAGLLGLMVGGVGVSNTMKVLLARRTLEIATLKTHGYRRGHLLALFAIETGMIGLAGGVLGTLVAVAISSQLMVLMSRTGSMLLEYQLDPAILLGGLAVGTITAIIFGLQSIVWASSVRPASLLRDLPSGRSWRTRGAVIALYLLLAALFSGLAIMIMGSVLEGVGAIGLGIALLGALAALLWLVLWGALKIPAPPFPMLTLARNNLNRQKGRSVLALIALFAGLFAISFSAAILLTGQERVTSRRGDESGYNLVVYGEASEEVAIVEQMESQGAEGLFTRYEVPITMLEVTSKTEDVEKSSPDGINLLEGRRPEELGRDVVVEVGNWSGESNTAILSTFYHQEPWNIEPGDSLTILSREGVTHTLQITGFYDVPEYYDVVGFANDIITDRETAVAIGGETGLLSVIGEAPVASLRSAASAIGTALPDTAVLSAADYNDYLTTAFRNLFAFVAGIAGLALFAGGVLIANAVGLTMVERRRELGVLKAVGYTSARVLRLLLAEYSLLGLIAGLIGTGAVYLMIAIVNLMQPEAQIALPPLVAAFLVLVGVLIAGGCAALVAWQPVHVRPLEVLRSE